MEQTILPITLLPIVSGLAVAGYGIHKETQYVSPLSIAVTLVNVIITLLFTNINSISFTVWAGISVFGIIVMAYDVKKHYQNPYIAFFFGSKSIGSITIFLGLTENNWTVRLFEPIFWLFVADKTMEISGIHLAIYIHLTGVLIILGIVHALGEIARYVHNH